MAIHDATNTTVERRSMLFERCSREVIVAIWLRFSQLDKPSIQVVLLESIVTDSSVVQKNIEMKTQVPKDQFMCLVQPLFLL